MQNVYADMGGNVMVHIAIPALGMLAMHWAVVSWSRLQMKREGIFDYKYIYRCDIAYDIVHIVRCPSSTENASVT